MSDKQHTQVPGNETDEEREARLAAEAEQKERERGLPGGAPEGLRAAADGEQLPDGKAAEMEAGALDFLCGDSPPVPFSVDATLETKDGPRKAVFHMVQMDGDRLDALENEHRRKDEGPLFGTVDVFRLNCAIVSEATRYMEDPKGRKVEPNSPEFVGESIAPPYAFERAFKRQPGIANMLAAEVRRMAGLQEDLVGKAKREPTGDAERTMTTAVGNS